jgi:hypothetical protein
MSAAPVKGIAIHWPGTTLKHIDATNKGHIAAILEGERKYHTRPGGLGVKQGGNDIAYQYAIDLMGRVWELRGAVHQSGANGNSASNKAYGAVTLLLGADDVPSAAMIQAVRDFRRKVWLARYPKATKVVGHRDVYSTDCPGPHAYPLVKNGTFAKAPVAPKPKPPVIPPPHPKPPVPPITKRTPLVTDYVFGLGRDAFTATTLAAVHFNVLQVFAPEQAKAAAAGGNHVVVVGGPAAAALGLAAPAGATTTIGRFICANGGNMEESITRGNSAIKALPAG